jgi:hypothetical protein
MAALVLAVGVLAVQPTPARADTFGTNFFPAHWGPNPYLTVAPSNPYYRSVGLIDNTGDPALSQHIQVFAQIINYVHTVYNPNYPVMLYLKDYHFAPGNPCAPGPQQFLVVCKDETLGGTGSSAPGTAVITTAFASHIYNAVARFRPGAVDTWCDNDKFTLVVQLISNTLGLDHNLTQPLSAMYPTIPVGRCTLNGWTLAEFDRLNQMYSHSVG